MAELPTTPDEIRRRVEAAGWEVRALEEPIITVEGSPGPPVVVATVARGPWLARITVAAVAEAPRWLAATYGGQWPATRTFDNASVWVSALDGDAARDQVERLDAALGEQLAFDDAVAALEADGWSIDLGRSTRDQYDSPGWDVRAKREREHLFAYASYRGALSGFEGTRLLDGQASRHRKATVLAVTVHSVAVAERLLGAVVEPD